MASRPLPVDGGARARLRDAQEAETQALRTIEGLHARAAVQRTRLDAAVARRQAELEQGQRQLDKAKGELARISGPERAALLLDEPLGEVRRCLRMAGDANRTPALERQGIAASDTAPATAAPTATPTTT